MKSLGDLVDAKDPAWPQVKSWLMNAACAVEVLPASEDKRAEALIQVQVTTRSVLGAVVFETGGLLVDHGWMRVLGSGHPRLTRSVPGWNSLMSSSGYYLVADDVIGGFFALDGGSLGFETGEIAYFAPDTLAWEGTGLQYSGFISWCLSGKLAEYYKDCRWTGWEHEIAIVEGSRALSIVPPLFTKGPPIGERQRRAVPIEEVWGLQQDFARQLRDVPDGAKFIIRAGRPEIGPSYR